MKNKLHLYQYKPEDVPHNFWFYDMIKDFCKTLMRFLIIMILLNYFDMKILLRL